MKRAAATAIVLLLLDTGCVRRTITVNTDPQGAKVILNDQHIGTTPASIDFTWYGDYDVQLSKDGYETQRTHYPIKTPWYELPGIDLIAEAFMPFTIHDQQVMSFKLEPAKPVMAKELIESARNLQERALFESSTGAKTSTRPAREAPQSQPEK